LDEKFVNPYTFVPLPPGAPQRAAPHGHLGDPELLSGVLTISIEAVAPLLIRGFGTADAPALPTRPDGTAFIPGSSLKGAIRSLHETLTGSCLRVFDEEFLPSYRDPVEASPDQLMAIVTQPPRGDQPPQVELCEPGDMATDRLNQGQLHGLNEQHPLKSGARLTLEGDQRIPRLDENGDWVVFISDNRNEKGVYHAHIRKPSGITADVPQDVWERFKELVKDTDDQRRGQREKRTDEVTTPLTITRESENGAKQVYEVGRRYIASADLRKGQPVWVKRDKNGIYWLGLAMAWRHFGKRPAGERVGKFGPCTSNDDLCPSCRLFGSADLSGKPDDPEAVEKAMQRSYRGHVRFGDALADSPVTPEVVTLPPLGVPHPGAGQFYLDNTGVEGKTSTGKNPPLREWGSEADYQKGKPIRALRGRKYYWHTPEFNGREMARAHQKGGEMTSKAAVFPAETRFTARITFTDIDSKQLGGLLSALHPARAMQVEGLLQHIGGGRPLGFGSCRIALVEGQVWRSGSRYGNGSAQWSLDDIEPLVTEFRESQRDLPRTLWRQIAEVLHPDAVVSAKVWYPPGRPWAQKGSEKFDTGFEFWKQTSGQGGKNGGYPLKSLPHVSSAPSHELPILDEPRGKDRS
jgi:CRISPR-associated protein (TIGR03986 family)